MAFICGSFQSQEEDDYDVLWPSPSTSPRKPTRKQKAFGSRRGKNATNPYSDRGLDKFEALLADLDKQRQKILTQKGSENVSMVKFIYKGPNEFRPIVVKLRDQRKQEKSMDHQKDVTFNEPEEDNTTKPSKEDVSMVDHEPGEKIRFDQCIKRKFLEWWTPSYYLPLFMILILVFLMFSGRSFAILCISIGWYLVPIFNEMLQDTKHKNKKVYMKTSKQGMNIKTEALK